MSCKVLSSSRQLDIKAAKKLLWASCLWLICHVNGGIAVGQVHDSDRCSSQLRSLVEELLPIIRAQTDDSSSMPELELDNVLSDLESYSRNIPTAIPSKTLAVNELRFRNGWFLDHGDKAAQRFHLQLLQETGVHC
mmetsp:Transcript_4198/g.15469  ORF Transcript_4198/g.15469 Transcript_4198/m.15469 type:complete len:136 (-) Transcript_4198:156-563(-)